MSEAAAKSSVCLLTFAGSECGRRRRQRAGDVPEQREAAVAQGGGGRQAAHHHGASASCYLSTSCFLWTSVCCHPGARGGQRQVAHMVHSLPASCSPSAGMCCSAVMWPQGSRLHSSLAYPRQLWQEEVRPNGRHAASLGCSSVLTGCAATTLCRRTSIQRPPKRRRSTARTCRRAPILPAS